MALPASGGADSFDGVVSLRKRGRAVADAADRGVVAPAARSCEASPLDGGSAAAAETVVAPSRRTRLQLAAAARGVPLATIVATVAVVVVVYLLGRLAYVLRDVLLLMVIAGFLALVLNPFVLLLQRQLHRRGFAVAVVVAVAATCFLGLVAAFGYPLSNGVAHLAHQLPSYVSDAEHGRGTIGRIVTHFHLQKWIDDNAPKLGQLGGNLARPALPSARALCC